MKLRKLNWDLTSGRNEVRIFHGTDLHIGADGFHRTVWFRFCDSVKAHPNCKVILTGDIIDAERPSMRDRKSIMYGEAGRKDAWSQEDERNFAWIDRDVIPKFAGIADKIAGMIDGDHFILFSNGMTSTQYICNRLKIPSAYLGERMAYLGLSFDRKNGDTTLYNILLRHGKGYGGTAGADVNALVRNNKGFLADLYLGGHTHKENCHCEILLYPNKDYEKLRQRIVWYVRGGSFLRGYPEDGRQTYVEQAEYSPLTTGWAEIDLVVNRVRENNLNIRVTEASARLVVA